MTEIAQKTASRLRLPIPVPGWAVLILGAGIVYAIIYTLIMQAYPEASVRFRLSLQPVLSAELPLQIHVIGALSAFLIGLVLFLAPKGFRLHKTLGWAWVAAMIVTAVSSFFLTGIIQDSFSPIHALSAWVMIGLPFGIAAIKRGNVRKHRKAMTDMYMGGMVIAGMFSFLPGRTMWAIFFTA